MRMYKITRIWFVEAKSIDEALMKSKNWKHDEVRVKRSSVAEFMSHDRWSHVKDIVEEERRDINAGV